MRIALILIKWWNHLWTANLTAEQEAEQILKYLLLKNSTAHSIEIYLALKVAMQSEMRKRELQAQATIKAVTAVWHNTNKP
jgi:hypothetical protein